MGYNATSILGGSKMAKKTLRELGLKPVSTTLKFQATPLEQKRLKRWRQEHDKTCRLVNTRDLNVPAGGRITFSFTPTGVGTAFRVSCACGASKDLTDYSTW